MKIRFIINPISGTGKQKGIEKLITKMLMNLDYDIVYTNESGNATKLMFFSTKNVHNLQTK